MNLLRGKWIGLYVTAVVELTALRWVEDHLRLLWSLLGADHGAASHLTILGLLPTAGPVAVGLVVGIDLLLWRLFGRQRPTVPLSLSSCSALLRRHTRRGGRQ